MYKYLKCGFSYVHYYPHAHNIDRHSIIQRILVLFTVFIKIAFFTHVYALVFLSHSRSFVVLFIVRDYSLDIILISSDYILRKCMWTLEYLLQFLKLFLDQNILQL